MSPSIPTRKEKYERRTYYLPASLIDEIDRIAAEETQLRKGTEDEEDVSANWVAENFLKWAVADYRQGKQYKPKKK